LGRGDRYEALRAKILFMEGVCKVKKPKVQRPVQRADETGVFNHFFTFSRMGPSTRRLRVLKNKFCCGEELKSDFSRPGYFF
jgi:hypothetical protein